MTELAMVVVIIGVLATLSTGMYKSVIVTARRGEAKANLAHVVALQAVYTVEYPGQYEKINLGYAGNGNTQCTGIYANNNLGFKPKDCTKLRYKYWADNSGNAAAYAFSDNDNYWIYPDCKGTNNNVGTCNTGNRRSGDRLELQSGQIAVCLDIVKRCPD